MSARAGAAQDLGSGLMPGRLVPLGGNSWVPGGLGSASKIGPLVGGRSIKAGGSGGLLECEEDVVSAPRDLARRGERGSLAADAFFDLQVELAVGAGGST